MESLSRQLESACHGMFRVCICESVAAPRSSRRATDQHSTIICDLFEQRQLVTRAIWRVVGNVYELSERHLKATSGEIRFAAAQLVE